MKRDLSAEAPSATPDHLDDAIDRVATRMTQVEPSEALASQIINALPDRSLSSGWWFQSWAPRLAMVAILAVAGVMWAARGSRDSTPAPSLAASQPIAAISPLMAAVKETVREPEPNRTMPLEPLEALEPLEPLDPKPADADFAHSLPSIAVVASLELAAIAPASLHEDAPLTLAPLAIADLPLTPDNNSPR